MSEFGSFSGAMKGISAGANNFNQSFQNSGGGTAGSPSLNSPQGGDLESSIADIMKKIKAKEKATTALPQGTVVDYDAEDPERYYAP